MIISDTTILTEVHALFVVKFNLDLKQYSLILNIPYKFQRPKTQYNNSLIRYKLIILVFYL